MRQEAAPSGQPPAAQPEPEGDRFEADALATAARLPRKEDVNPPSEAVVQAQKEQAAQADALQAEAIYFQMGVDRRREEARRAEVLAELDTDVMERWQSVLIHRQKVFDSAAEAWLKILIS